MSERYPSQTAEKIVVRLPDGMRDRLAVAAKANNRSVNAEVVARLEASFNMIPIDAVDLASSPNLKASMQQAVITFQSILARYENL